MLYNARFLADNLLWIILKGIYPRWFYLPFHNTRRKGIVFHISRKNISKKNKVKKLVIVILWSLFSRQCFVNQFKRNLSKTVYVLYHNARRKIIVFHITRKNIPNKNKVKKIRFLLYCARCLAENVLWISLKGIYPR